MEYNANSLREYLRKHVLIADGAAGTYLASVSGRSAQPCEMLNLSDPRLVEEMHKEYVRAGAKLILTNTFGASMAGASVGGDFSATASILRAGVELARRAARSGAFVAGDIGPLPEASAGNDVLELEYRRVIDTFLQCGVDIFVFETFSSSRYPVWMARAIREKKPDAFILVSFAVLPDGNSREGVSGQRLAADVVSAGCADAVGFNCCSGPSHLLRFFKTVDYGGLIPSIMPNAGYPQRENDGLPPSESGLSYSGSPEYFAGCLADSAKSGFRIVGGCCGTTPRHIERLARALSGTEAAAAPRESSADIRAAAPRRENAFLSKLESGRRAVLVELDPPLGSDISPLLASARALRDAGVNAVTVADSPMARPRIDSVAAAALLRRECGIEAIPHICCRDKNINAIKSTLLAAHMEGLRNLLAVTGDPVPDTDRGTVKSVFNLNSEGLCRFIGALNGDVFRGDELCCGCAFNVNAANPHAELERLRKKLDAGARFVLTQPAFTPEAVRAAASARALGAKICVGILAPVSYKNALFLANEMPGFTLPEKYLRRFSPGATREEGEIASVALATELARGAAEAADGFYLIVPFNRTSLALRLLESFRQNGLL